MSHWRAMCKVYFWLTVIGETIGIIIWAINMTTVDDYLVAPVLFGGLAGVAVLAFLLYLLIDLVENIATIKRNSDKLVEHFVPVTIPSPLQKISQNIPTINTYNTWVCPDCRAANPNDKDKCEYCGKHK